MFSRGFPPVPKNLLDALDECFPNEMPAPYLTLEEIRIKQGERKVVQFLKARYAEQTGVQAGDL